MMQSGRSQRLTLFFLLVAFVATSCGCVTTTVWTVGLGSCDCDDSEREEEDHVHDAIPVLLILTPFCLAIDLVTWPLQEWYWEDDDDR